MTQSVFVLRPEPGLSATLARGRKLGLAMEAMPLSHAEPVEWKVPDGPFDGILLGSANGLRHAGGATRCGLDFLPRLPVYAVGRATAEAALAQRFPIAEVGKGGLQTLIDALPGDETLRFLRLAGEEHVALECPPGVTIETAITYRIAHRPLDDAQVARLAEGGVVLLHSGAAARHFDAECRRTGVDRAALSLAAIGPRVARSVSDGWKSVAAAATPNDGALLSLAANMCH